jgi:hypothetical protein
VVCLQKILTIYANTCSDTNSTAPATAAQEQKEEYTGDPTLNHASATRNAPILAQIVAPLPWMTTPLGTSTDGTNVNSQIYLFGGEFYAACQQCPYAFRYIQRSADPRHLAPVWVQYSCMMCAPIYAEPMPKVHYMRGYRRY